MSIRPTQVSTDIHDYILKHFSAEDEFLNQLLLDAEKYDIPNIHIAADQGRFLQFILKTINAKNVLEVGSLAGYSAIIMARALQEGGTVTALELNPDYADFIRKKASDAGLKDKIKVIVGDAKTILRSFQPDHKFDLAFVDADKLAYSEYLDLIEPKLRIGGIIAVDNALGFGEIAKEFPDDSKLDEVKAIQRFNEALSKNDNFLSCLVPVGDGMAMGVKIK